MQENCPICPKMDALADISTTHPNYHNLLMALEELGDCLSCGRSPQSHEFNHPHKNHVYCDSLDVRLTQDVV
jgi:hypothetical protein